MNSLFITILTAAILLCAATAQEQCSGEATYRVRFNFRWTRSRFPNRPGGAHFSPLVAFSHAHRFSSFTRFGYATDGVQSVAETGQTRIIRRELTTAQENGQVLEYKVGSGPGAEGETSLEIKVNCKSKYISAISMVAPSPDWFVGVFRESVVRNGKFRKRISGKLRVYDAGTDAGETFNAPNQRSNPVQNIAPLDGPSFNGKPVGRFMLTKID